MTAPALRLRWGQMLRLIGAHYGAAILAGGVLAFTRVLMSLPSPPDIGAWFLLWYLAAVQIAIAGAGAAALAVLAAAAAPRRAGIIFPVSGAVTALVITVAVEQVNPTFAIPAISAGVVYGAVLYRFVWRQRGPAP